MDRGLSARTLSEFTLGLFENTLCCLTLKLGMSIYSMTTGKPPEVNFHASVFV